MISYKKCSRCNNEKPVVEFSALKGGRFRSACKKCRANRNRELANMAKWEKERDQKNRQEKLAWTRDTKESQLRICKETYKKAQKRSCKMVNDFIKRVAKIRSDIILQSDIKMDVWQLHLNTTKQRTLNRNSVRKKKGLDPQQLPTINKQDLEDLWEQQRGLCAITGVPMLKTYGSRDPRQVSLDRINNDRGYHPDNIHLVCFFINVGRNSLDLQTTLDFIQEIKLAS